MKKKRNIVIVNLDQHDNLPAGNDIFYLCLNCRSIIQSHPETYSTCKCGNVLVDVDAGRGGANDISNLLILKIEQNVGNIQLNYLNGNQLQPIINLIPNSNMIDFCNVELETSFSLKYSEFDELRPVFDEFYRKTGLVIDEYGDTRLIIDNLFLIKDIAIDYTKKDINKETRVLIQSFIKNLEMITKGGYHFFVSGDQE